MSLSHTSAKPSHYNKEAESYDAFNEANSAIINKLIEKIFRKYQVKTILDLACGTGSQVFWLAKQGFDVVGVDINTKMLKIARSKAKQEKLNLKLIKGDMRTTQAGKFDAVLTIFNAIGHLTKQDFEKALRNIHANLHNQGLYIFDIFNLNYLLSDNNITHLTIDRQVKSDDITTREIQYSTISKEGILASYDIYYEEKDGHAPKISKASQTLQVYSAKQLKALLKESGFNVLRQCGIDGSDFAEGTMDCIVTIAQKQDELE